VKPALAEDADISIGIPQRKLRPDTRVAKSRRLAHMRDVSGRHGEGVSSSYRCPTNKTPLNERRFFTSGADGRNRTGDLRITNALLYQLSYIGEKQRAL
jgi:hypothetical protein